ncbi:MAG: 3-phosphoshikimate 1-carboxyvinyltransferase [Lachnospiraceae bacterium]|nr:3-phosphoshikimate 1-carboxyvinyltransferase [Lachnospiraceae bacterium]
MKFHAEKALRGTVKIPGDKSISHRSVLLGAIANGDTTAHGFLRSADCLATIDCFRALGISIEERTEIAADGSEDNVVIIHGKGLRGLSEPSKVLDAMNSGTTVRLISGILSGQNFDSTITGDASLRKRPMRRIMEPLEMMGIMTESVENNDCIPLIIHGGNPRAIRYTSKVASAQVKSCVLLAGLYAEDPTFLTEPALSRNHTELMLSAFGGNVKSKVNKETGEATAIVYPGTILEGQEITIPGDISSAAYFLAAGLLVPGSEILLQNVGINDTRDGILRVIRAMGGSIKLNHVRMEGGEPVADILVSASELHGTKIGGSLIPTLIDEIPVIAVMAACADGDTEITDASELRVKESDRLAAIAEGLTAMGISVEERKDGLLIHGGTLHGASIRSLGDHRLAMAFAIAGIVAEGETEIDDIECVNISYPEFFADLENLRSI